MASSFRKLSENLAKLAQVPSRIAGPACIAINRLIATQFANGQDPYGKSWAPLLPQTVRRKYGDTRILIRSSDLAAQTWAQPSSGAGIQLVTLPFASRHQGGTKHMVARPIFPQRAQLPAAWRAIINDAYRAAFGKAMGI